MSNYPSYQTPASCGCPTPTSVSPPDSVVIPAGTHVIQMPCPVGSAPQSSSALQANPLVQNGGPGGLGGCEMFRPPRVLNTFITKGIDQTGTFKAECASSWGLPGLLMYFPGLGYLEVLGASGNNITYKNISIDQGTEINSDISFYPGIPKPPAAAINNTVDTGGGAELVFETGALTTSIWGENNGVPTRIEPVQGNVLMGIGGKWQRVLLGQNRYPVSAPTILHSFTRTAGNVTYNVALPNKPTLPEGKTLLGVEVDFVMRVVRDGPESTSVGITTLINDQNVSYLASDQRLVGDSGSTIANMLGSATTIKIQISHNPANAGTMYGSFALKAYHY